MLKHVGSALLLFLLSVPVFAQAPAVKEERRFPLVQVNVSGSQRYSAAAIIAVLGLHTGQQSTQQQLQDASQTLANSGLFSLVQFRFGWAGNGVVANYELTDNTQLIPIGFENFVWFAPNELATAIKQKLPLFTGVVPLSGDFRDQVTEALQQIIAEKKITGQVTSIPQGALNGPVQAMLYRVEGHDIKVTGCSFTGAEHADPLALSELAKYISATRYEKSVVNNYIPNRLKDLYDNIGYLNAKFDEPEVKLLSTASDHSEIALTTAVHEGSQYTVAGVTWSGNNIANSDQLTEALKFQRGQVASIPKFRERLAAIRQLYGKYGYIGVKMEFTPKLAADHTAVFNVKLHEGVQYRLGTVQFQGIDQLTVGKILSTWKLKSGEIYDDNYPREYMSIEFAKYVPHHLEWQWRNRETIHDDTKVVDLIIEIQFKPRSM